MKSSIIRTVLTAGCLFLIGSVAWSQTSTNAPIIYPAKGQSPAQVEKDKNECYAWAKKETGYDPVAALQAQQAQASQPKAPAEKTKGGAVPGAAKGAAAGAAIGAVAGNAGKGAAIGATAGGVTGAARKRRQEAEVQKQAAAQQQAEAQKKAAENTKFDNYMRAFKACMEGKGYTVK
jgi:hypothetical protein